MVEYRYPLIFSAGWPINFGVMVIAAGIQVSCEVLVALPFWALTIPFLYLFTRSSSHCAFRGPRGYSGFLRKGMADVYTARIP